MAQLPISEDERSGLLLLRELSDSSFNQLYTNLESSPASIPSVDGLTPVQVQQVVDTLKSMYQTRVSAEVAVSEFVDDVGEALREEDEEFRPSPQFRDRLSKILSIEALHTEAKAFILYGEHANVFCSTRILTDIRAVFGANVSDPPEAYIVTHTLKIDYHGSRGRLEEFFVGLASEDLVELKIAIDRAELKAQSLRKLLEKTNVRFIDSQHPGGK